MLSQEQSSNNRESISQVANEMPIENISPNSKQPRKSFDEEELASLTEKQQI